MRPAHPHNRAKVLIVDDAADVSTTLAWVLRQNGYQTTCAGSKAEALRLCSEAAPAVALIEMTLPDATGIETARELCRYAPGCRILFMSGDPDAGHFLQQARAAGLDCELLPKPIPVPDLLAALQQVLALAASAGVS